MSSMNFFVYRAPFDGFFLSSHANIEDAQKRIEREKDPQNCKIIGYDQYDSFVEAYTKTLTTKPVETTEERFNDMLEMLPPCRWHQVGEWNVFHMSERNYGDIVTWFALNRNGKAFTFDEFASIQDSEILELLNAA